LVSTNTGIAVSDAARQGRYPSSVLCCPVGRGASDAPIQRVAALRAILITQIIGFNLRCLKKTKESKYYKLKQKK